jgi:hypothetical protein
MRSGVNEFLVFPPDPKDLAGAVDRLVRRGRTETARGSAIAVHSAKGGSGRRASRSTPRTRSPGTRRARAWRWPTSW